MQGNSPDHHEAIEHLDADAVCEACGNVNPEGTLLCKTCGNNLRDQRARRMQAGGPPVAAKPSINIGNIVSGVFIVFGICAVLWAAFNVSTIEAWLLSGVQSVEAKGDNVVAPETFWQEPDAARYDELAAALEEHALTVAEAGIVPPGSPLPSLDGRYILKRSAVASASPVGSAMVQTEGDQVYFVAKLAGGTEIRGNALKTSDIVFQANNMGILDPDGTVSYAYGIGQLQQSGEIDCSGYFGEYETLADIVAIPVASADQPAAAPEPAADETPAEGEPAAQ